MNKWISVEDRFPECNLEPDSFGVQVLIWPHATFRGTADSPTAFFGCRVTDEPSFYMYGAVVDDVEYWMYLPEGPKVKKYSKDVHTEHCTISGCKYGDEDCTVTTGKKPASYPDGDDW